MITIITFIYYTHSTDNYRCLACSRCLYRQLLPWQRSISCQVVLSSQWWRRRRRHSRRQPTPRSDVWFSNSWCYCCTHTSASVGNRAHRRRPGIPDSWPGIPDSRRPAASLPVHCRTVRRWRTCWNTWVSVRRARPVKVSDVADSTCFIYLMMMMMMITIITCPVWAPGFNK